VGDEGSNHSRHDRSYKIAERFNLTPMALAFRCPIRYTHFAMKVAARLEQRCKRGWSQDVGNFSDVVVLLVLRLFAPSCCKNDRRLRI